MNPSMLSVPKSRVAVSWVDIPVKGTQVVLRGRLHDTYPTDPIDVVVPKTVALVLHPHPRLGGDAENNVTVALTRAISRTELIPCLRFDSRGVGESSGSATWFGSSEPDDIIAVLDFLTDPAGRVRAERVFVVGYSFGSSVLGTALSYIYALDLAASSQGATTAGASAAAAGASSPLLPASTVALLDAALAGRLARAIVGAIFVSYPCGFFARFLLGGHVSSLRTLVAAAPSLPLLFVTAEGDELTSASAVQVMVRRLNSPNATVITHAGGSHTWFNDEQRPANDVLGFIQRLQAAEKQRRQASASAAAAAGGASSLNITAAAASSASGRGFQRGRLHRDSQGQVMRDMNMGWLVFLLLLFVLLNVFLFFRFAPHKAPAGG